jgi:hypothetical protein
MRATWLVAALCVLFFSATTGSVFAVGYEIAVPILGTSGAPALVGSNFAGIITVLYADGRPVVLGSNQVDLNLCSSNSTGLTCETLRTTLDQTAPGTYSYSFAVPTSLTGTVIVYIRAGSLEDDNGRIFPTVDTQISSYATPSSSPGQNSQSASPLPASPPLPEQSSNQPINQAVVSTQPRQSSPIVQVILVLTVLLLAGLGLLAAPRRK